MMMSMCSFGNAHSLFGIIRGPAWSVYKTLKMDALFNTLWGFQAVTGTILLFFLLLTIRNRFRLK
jgi:hypothetical protein